ncbi:hypothetical protein syc0099_d [Synechococcus elongatus PCC 6301]|uniref:DUF218 domain-containing protein n=1 Tax=Synechococcus sp. (strain ATCC 27144 / PCC 6301 / SAUG 1402/1) TaxID=269084 RepID=A0A0H3JZ84_SYNP6|nr:YdcF family protein [Synechococcus elongatus]BAD78289.1 hypothetical protein syc0099_d [Synechococcus elongatus PCC 6301]
MHRLIPITLLLSLGVVWGLNRVAVAQRSPQAIFVLGGDPQREQFAAELAQTHPDLPIWVSSGSNPEYAEWVFGQAGVPRSRLHLDYQATDTLSNFTSLADRFQQQGIQHVYLVTSDYHMRRALVIANIVFASRGITFEPVPVPFDRASESWRKAIRDGGRAIIWVLLGPEAELWLSKAWPQVLATQTV